MKPMSVPGRCRCGRVTFTLLEEPLSFYLCHCTDCQAESGSAFGQSMAVRREAIGIVEGPVREHVAEPEQGAAFHLFHCANCLTPLWGYARVPEVYGLNAGALEARDELQPYGNMWTRSARPWVGFAPGPRYETQPDDPLEMIRIWQGRPQNA